MTPSARLQAAIEIVEALETSRLPADRFIREFFRARRYAGSKDRANVSELVYGMFRHRASFAWRMGSEAPRALAMAALLKSGSNAAQIEALFDGEGYGPKPLTDEERAVLIVPPSGDAPASARSEYPAFLEAELRRAFGEALMPEMEAMQGRAPIDMRVNTLKAQRDDVVAQLRADGYDAEPTPHSPIGIRIPSGEGAAALGRTKAFESGAFEFQDEAAQVAVMLCGAKPSLRVLDLAAGAGGKSLALAAAMNNFGEITAHDIDEGRLRQIAPRAHRAGVTIIQTHAGPNPPRRPYDLVLLDAPCSGSGTWRRQPENKWRLTPARLDELNALQDMLLDQAAARAAGKARIVYATCSILPRENEDRVAAFLARHPSFAVVPATVAWGESPAPPGLGEFLRASPLSTGTDGFFTAILARKT
ncbi:MAG TPA: RsmB/NOP family class I SAM-dependent RNA methyltransferase [Rhizomicrobium sp.]|jgi:16S rRNA (cytosine967-C5)-methyltransferase